MTAKRLAKKIGIPIVALLLLTGATVGFFYEPLTTDTYQGQEIFRTEAEYTAFKEAMGSKGVKIEDMKSLSSTPPIIVSYHIVVPAHQPFPYGTEGIGTLLMTGYIVGLIAISAIIVTATVTI